jgi:hypothetical protein
MQADFSARDQGANPPAGPPAHAFDQERFVDARGRKTNRRYWKSFIALTKVP